MNQSPIVSRYLSTESAAAYLCFSPRTLEKLRCSGGGPRFIKRGKKVLYALDDLDRWMQAGARGSTSESAQAA
jgi:hypothetical protein